MDTLRIEAKLVGVLVSERVGYDVVDMLPGVSGRLPGRLLRALSVMTVEVVLMDLPDVMDESMDGMRE